MFFFQKDEETYTTYYTENIYYVPDLKDNMIFSVGFRKR